MSGGGTMIGGELKEIGDFEIENIGSNGSTIFITENDCLLEHFPHCAPFSQDTIEKHEWGRSCRERRFSMMENLFTW